MSIHRIATTTHVRELAATLLNENRERPVAVISIPENHDTPLVDVDQIHNDVGDYCDIHLITTGPLTYELSDLLPERCQVYGGASRVYPVSTRWQTQPEASPLHFVHNPNQRHRITDNLINDALRMAADAGLFAKPQRQATQHSGVVASLLADNTRAIVTLDNGGLATIVHELVHPDIPLEWVVHEGQRVNGTLDSRTGWFTPQLTTVTAPQLLEHYPHGTVTLGYVLNVDRQTATIAPHPDLPLTVAKRDITSNPLDRVDLLLAAGDVVNVRIIRDQQGRTALRLHDIDDTETAQPALPLTPDGKPWLLENRHEPQLTHDTTGDDDIDDGTDTGDDALDESSPHRYQPDSDTTSESPEGDTTPAEQAGPHPADGPHRVAAAITAPTQTPAKALQATQLALQKERADNQALRRELQQHRANGPAIHLELEQLLAENRRLKNQLSDLRQDQQAQRAMLRKAMQTTASLFAARRERFDKDDEWMRHEIHLAWIDRYDAQDRQQWPIPDTYDIGERFINSLDDLDDNQTTKALKAVVDIITGRVRELPARSAHPLRRGDGATAEDLVRDDGARCMRVHIEKNVPSARRLHYWVNTDGRIELSRVVLHDDMEP